MASICGGIIKSIDQSTVHRICSGQVVLTLAVAVKELVENSLDSGANSIDVRLKEFGSESVEVHDNGNGISQANFETLCLKHYTSKLQQFEDLPNVETFGFRGEALSSLCALSNLTVSTCKRGQSVGWRLEYDSHGRLTKQTQHSRQPGTTVTLCNLFHSLPVRHKEFLKHLKREFNKMLTVLTGYCLISRETRITCTNHTGGRLSTLLSTKGATNFKDNFTLIYGIKSWQNMLELSAVRPSEETMAEFGLSSLPTDGSTELFELEGFVSTCAHGCGRSCSDRQFYFVNGRPCDPMKVSKLVNEVYHSFNRHQYPCIVLNIVMKKSHVDVNVTPDKRQILVSNEKILLAIIKASLLELYAKIPSTFALQNTSIRDETREQVTPIRSNAIRTSLAAFAASGWKPTNSSPTDIKRKLSPVAKQRKLDSYIVSSPPEKKSKSSAINDNALEFESTDHGEAPVDYIDASSDRIKVEVIETVDDLELAIENLLPVAEKNVVTTIPFSMETLFLAIETKKATTNGEQSLKRFLARISADNAQTAEDELGRQIDQSDFAKMRIVGQFNLGFIIAKLNSDLFIVDQHAADEKYNFETLQRTTRLKAQRLVCTKQLNLTAANEALLIDNIEIFRNNGFDFVVKPDEEATKRVLLSSVPMSGNWLFGPADVDELLFILQDSNVTGGEPMSDTQMARYRPSRVRAMFASRACRKAVMVGTALTLAQMSKLINQLGELQQPWNCPHGRPTMRHLINLDMLKC